MLTEPPPIWMSAQIDKDLAPFQEIGVTQEMLDKTIEATHEALTGGIAMLIRYKIVDNEISYTSHYMNDKDVRITGFISFIRAMAKLVKLPDVEFIMSLADSYDRPVFLMNNFCPVFTVCKCKTNRKGVLVPEVRIYSFREGLFASVNEASKILPWRIKQDTAFWCGRTTGRFYGMHNWDFQPRPRLRLFSLDHPELLEAYFTLPTRMNNNLKPYFEEEGYFQPFTSAQESMRYKYLIAVDGVSFPSSYWWQLLSNCTVIKGESEFIEWFYSGALPYVHYIPYNQDCSDLEEKIQWLKMHDAEAQKIAENGRAFALEFLGNEGMILYYYTLFNRYAQLQRF